MAEAGSVMFNFHRCGEVAVTGVSEDDAYNAAMECGAEDVEPLEHEEDGSPAFKLITDATAYGSVRDSVLEMGVNVDEEHSGLTYHPMALVELEDDEQFSANEALYDRCLELDDVDAIYTTCADVGRNKP
jgi:transcriptional/translational regulatory protein YebC/TACO1